MIKYPNNWKDNPNKIRFLNLSQLDGMCDSTSAVVCVFNDDHSIKT